MPSLPGDPTSVWHANRPAPRLPTLDRDLDAEVVVVGGGVCGLTTAALLHDADVRVALVEARTVGAGVSGRSTGHLTELIDGSYHLLKDDFGADALPLIRSAARQGIEEVRRTAERYGVDARFRRVPAYLYAETDAQREGVEKEWRAAREAGLDARLVSAIPAPFPVKVALELGEQGEFDPYAYCAGLAEALHAAGVPIFEGARVVEVEGGAPVRLTTEAGQGLTARRVVLATHTPLGVNPVQTVMSAHRSYVVGFRLPPGEAYPQALLFDAADPYHYTRTAEGPDGPVLLVGGADHRAGEGGAEADTYGALLGYARSRWPGAEAVFRYSGVWFEPHDGLPMIGESPTGENVLIATGFDGDGLVWSASGARILADLARGVESPYADLLSPKRLKPAARAKGFVKEAAEIATHLVKGTFATDVDGPEALAPGEGGLARVGGDRLALYRDDEGTVHALSPICSHLKCTVRWNRADQTWDCPCHGSRFDPRTGEIVSGPAMHGLEPGGQGAEA